MLTMRMMMTMELPVFLAAATASGVLLISVASLQADKVREYCHYETFRASCPDDQLLLMKTAYYGRKNIGRCVKNNFGFIGCFSNVLDVLDRHCSGKVSCEVEVIEPNFENIRPCNDELKNYLEAEYTCLTVAEASLNGCHVSLSNQRGPTFLSKHQVTPCGGGVDAQSAWNVHAAPGQRINVTLFEFSPASRESSVRQDVGNHDGGRANELLPASVAVDRELRGGKMADDVYGEIFESTATVGVGIEIRAGLGGRERHVLTSSSSDIKVILNNFMRDGYLLTFTVVGCADVTPSELAEDVHVQYSTDRSTAHVICRDSDIGMGTGTSTGIRMEQTWKLACVEGVWQGFVANCSKTMPIAVEADTGRTSATSSSQYTYMKTSSAIVAMIIVGVSITISLCVLSVGLIILRRFPCRSSDHVAVSSSKTVSSAKALARHHYHQHNIHQLSKSSEDTSFIHVIPKSSRCAAATNNACRHHQCYTDYPNVRRSSSSINFNQQPLWERQACSNCIRNGCAEYCPVYRSCSMFKSSCPTRLLHEFTVPGSVSFPSLRPRSQAVQNDSSEIAGEITECDTHFPNIFGMEKIIQNATDADAVTENDKLSGCPGCLIKKESQKEQQCHDY